MTDQGYILRGKYRRDLIPTLEKRFTFRVGDVGLEGAAPDIDFVLDVRALISGRSHLAGHLVGAMLIFSDWNEFDRLRAHAQ